MNKAILIIIIFLFAFTNLNAQINLVPNGDFEIYDTLPTNISQSNRALGWNNVNGHYTGYPWGSPDYYNILSFIGTSFGTITPFSGNAQMGLILYEDAGVWREYISTQLATPMIIGHHYTISFSITNGSGLNNYTRACNNLGIKFSNNPLFQNTCNQIPVIPQLEITSIIYILNSWQHFSFNYTADSSYNYITIGNFRNDAQTLISTFGIIGTYYFIDKIEMFPSKIKIVGDSIICKGDTTTLTVITDSTVKWAYALKPDSIISTNASIKVNPDFTTTYLVYGNNNDTAWFTVNVINPPIINLGNDTILCNGKELILNANQSNASYVWQDNTNNSTYNITHQGVYWVTVTTPPHCSKTDTIIITYQKCDTPDIYIPNSFTPNGDGLNDEFKIVSLKEFSEFKMSIYNRWGELLFESTDKNKGWDGTFKGKYVPYGVYVYLVTGTIKDTNEQIKRNGTVTVLR